MSGGSFNYLCGKNAADLDACVLEDISAMARALERHGEAGALAARATLALHKAVSESLPLLQSRMDQLREVWKAVEWHLSGDWGEERVAMALVAFQRRDTAEPMPDGQASPGEAVKAIREYLRVHPVGALLSGVEADEMALELAGVTLDFQGGAV